MLDKKEITIGENIFELSPLKGRKALRLDRKVVTLLLPVFKGIDMKDMSMNALQSNIDLGAIVDGITEGLGKMSEQEYSDFIEELLSTVIVKPKGVAPAQMSGEVLDTLCLPPIDTYKLLFEVMRYNKFTPFALGLGGEGMMRMFSSSAQTGSQSS